MNCSQLVFLDIRDNCFTVLPTLLCLIKTLAVLECGENPLTEPVNTYRMEVDISHLKLFIKIAEKNFSIQFSNVIPCFDFSSSLLTS